jgi:uncharacterized membrane protein HdeD (DUF308 family)
MKKKIVFLALGLVFLILGIVVLRELLKRQAVIFEFFED